MCLTSVSCLINMFWLSKSVAGVANLTFLNKSAQRKLEPRHDKINKETVLPAKTQISLGIRPVWSESSLCAQWVVKIQAFFMRTAKTLIRLGGCPGWFESSLGAQPFCCFCRVAAHLSNNGYELRSEVSTCLQNVAPTACSSNLAFNPVLCDQEAFMYETELASFITYDFDSFNEKLG